MKQSLDASFYHPGVLATLAPYNAAFGRHFDELFHAAASEIKEFAAALQEQGGSILGNVEGVDVTVEHVAALEERDLLKVDYSTALEKFRRVSKLKQALERRPPIRRMSFQMKVPKQRKAVPERRRQPVLDLEAMRSAVTPQQIATEETKLRQVEESVRIFVRVADPKFRQVVPMRFLISRSPRPRQKPAAPTILRKRAFEAAWPEYCFGSWPWWRAPARNWKNSSGGQLTVLVETTCGLAA